MNIKIKDSKKITIAHISSQVAPFSKTGGMADVVKALLRKQGQFGNKAIVITPGYGFIKNQNLERKTIIKSLSVKIRENEYSFAVKEIRLSNNVKVYFICNRKMFGNHKIYGTGFDGLRFYFFNLAALRLMRHLNFVPDIMHCHCWHAGLIPNLIKKSKFFAKSATVFTIHNLIFQGAKNWWEVPLEKNDSGKKALASDMENIEYINFTKRGILYADIINTVSELHAKEILSAEFGQGLEKFLQKRKKDVYGIINGIDYKVHNPLTDDNVYYKYDCCNLGNKKKNKLALQKELGLAIDKNIPILGFANRLSEEKGVLLLQNTIHILLKLNLQIIIVCDNYGSKKYVKFFKKIARLHPDKFVIYIRKPFPEDMESKMFAASDMFLMPSSFEPCGISQMKSLRYGSVPIVHKTGGLSDTINDFNPRTNKGNGFVFQPCHKEEFLMAIARALENYKYPKIWEYLTWRGMKESFSWKLPAKKYSALYKIAIKKRLLR